MKELVSWLLDWLLRWLSAWLAALLRAWLASDRHGGELGASWPARQGAFSHDPSVYAAHAAEEKLAAGSAAVHAELLAAAMARDAAREEAARRRSRACPRHFQ